MVAVIGVCAQQEAPDAALSMMESETLGGVALLGSSSFTV
jgi:hypothetical protein